MSEGKGTKRKGEGESWCWCAFGGSAETLAAAVGFTLVRVCVCASMLGAQNYTEKTARCFSANISQWVQGCPK